MEQCRKLLSRDLPLDDTDLERQRDALYALADLVVEIAADPEARARLQNREGDEIRLQEALQALHEADREEVEERAAIMEYEGEMKRDAAERAALGGHLRSEAS